MGDTNEPHHQKKDHTEKLKFQGYCKKDQRIILKLIVRLAKGCNGGTLSFFQRFRSVPAFLACCRLRLILPSRLASKENLDLKWWKPNPAAACFWHPLLAQKPSGLPEKKKGTACFEDAKGQQEEAWSCKIGILKFLWSCRGLSLTAHG